MCAADVNFSLFPKNFTLRLSGRFDHVLVASNNVEICVESRIRSEHIGLKVKVELRITFSFIRKTVIQIQI